VNGALAGVRVVELAGEAHYAIPYAVKLLADLGAEVVLVEGETGHPLRRGHPGMADDPAIVGAVFSFLSVGKRCVAEGAAELARADIVIGPLGALPSDARPGSVHVSVSPWGNSGPYLGRPVTPLVQQAAAGWVTSRKEVGLWPVQVGGHMAEWASGSYIAAAALTALRAARDNGDAVTVDIALHECLHAMLCYDKLRYDARGELGVSRDRILVAPFGIRPCKDGWIGINTLTEAQWADACRMTGLEDYIDQMQAMNRGEGDLAAFGVQLEAFLADKCVGELVVEGQAKRIPVVPVGHGNSMCDFPQWKEREFFVAGESRGRSYRQPGSPFRMSASLRAERSNPAAPMLDCFAPLAMTAGCKPLTPLRVIDLSHFWSGPYLTQYLGSYGADVIKVESIQRPDNWRYNHTAPSLGTRWWDRGTLWQATNLDKRSLTLDLTDAAAQDILMQLCADADIFVENYTIGVLARFGISWERLHAANPRLIMLRLPGYGLEGPWKDYLGWGDAFEQVCGLTMVTGHPGGRPQIPGGYMDPIVGMHAVTALLAAMKEREQTGLGQLIEVSQIEVCASMCAALVISAELGTMPQRQGNRAPGFAPQGVYRCGEEYVALSVRDVRDWLALLELLGHPPSLAGLETLADRHGAHDAIDTIIQEWTTALTAEEVEAALIAAGIPASRLLRPARYTDEPQFAARAFYQEVEHPLSGKRLFPVFPMRYSFESDRNTFSRPAPMLGQHNAEILGELGLTSEDIASLETRNIIGTEPLK
jgi:crotonobetainyl-CoA:carnitine CoA-transferase CaiB-like acyl-CoA transferase